MKVLIACEKSGIGRDAFLTLGYDAWSCDLLPTESPGPHLQMNILDLLEGWGSFNKGCWDLMIAHPECTRLCNSGVRWLHERNLWAEMRMAARFFRTLLDAPVEKICVENPIPHKYALKIIGRKYDQIIQPWQFGHPETKATCLWLKGLEPLVPTNTVKGREHRIHRMPPGPNRSKLRSTTFPGIAAAFADQWS